MKTVALPQWALGAIAVVMALLLVGWVAQANKTSTCQEAVALGNEMLNAVTSGGLALIDLSASGMDAANKDIAGLLPDWESAVSSCQ